MFGIEITRSDGREITGDDIYLGSIGEVIEIKPRTTITIFPRDSQYNHIFLPFGGVYSGGFYVNINSDGSLFVDNNSDVLSFYVAIVRGGEK